jgi:uncharacterized membrane protein YagU involved in acid resistance
MKRREQGRADDPHDHRSDRSRPARGRGRRTEPDLDVAEAMLKGALAGLTGGAAMMMAMKAQNRALLPEEERLAPPPKQLVETVAERQGVSLSDRQATAAGMGVHMGYSALWGAVYGVVQSRLHPPDLLHGLLLGGLVYAANFPELGLLPRLGVLPPPSEQPLEKAAIPVTAHLVFGLATSRAFGAMT